MHEAEHGRARQGSSARHVGPRVTKRDHERVVSHGSLGARVHCNPQAAAAARGHPRPPRAILEPFAALHDAAGERLLDAQRRRRSGCARGGVQGRRGGTGGGRLPLRLFSFVERVSRVVGRRALRAQFARGRRRRQRSAWRSRLGRRLLLREAVVNEAEALEHLLVALDVQQALKLVRGELVSAHEATGMEQLAAATAAPSPTGAGAAPPAAGRAGGAMRVQPRARGGQCGRSAPLRPAAGPVRSPVAIVRFGDAS